MVLDERNSDYNRLLLKIYPDVPSVQEYLTRRTDWNRYQIRVAELLSGIAIIITNTETLGEAAVLFSFAQATSDTNTTIRRTSSQYYIIPNRIRVLNKEEDIGTDTGLG